MHRGEGHQHADRQRENGDQRAADVQEEHDAHQRDDEAFLDQRVRERVDRAT